MNVDKINTFLLGSIQDDCIIKCLPAEIRHEIWKSFFSDWKTIDLIKTGIVSIVQERIENKSFDLSELLTDIRKKKIQKYILFEYAIQSGKIKMFELFLKHNIIRLRKNKNGKLFIRSFIKNVNNIEMVKYLYKRLDITLNNLKCCGAMSYAIKNGRLDVIYFLQEVGYTKFQCTGNTLSIAAENNFFHTVKWAMDNATNEINRNELIRVEDYIIIYGISIDELSIENFNTIRKVRRYWSKCKLDKINYF